MSRERLRRARAAFLNTEFAMFLGYALIVFRPGARPPQHPGAKPLGPQTAPADWEPEEYQAYIDEARRDMDNQQADKRDIRARAQIVLTTALVLGGTLVASYTDKSQLCLGQTLAYLPAAVIIALTALGAGGIITAQSPIGAPNLAALLSTSTGGVQRRLADGYAATRHHGAATVAVLVTVLRDCVLALILGAGLLALAHILT